MSAKKVNIEDLLSDMVSYSRAKGVVEVRTRERNYKTKEVDGVKAWEEDSPAIKAIDKEIAARKAECDAIEKKLTTLVNIDYTWKE